MLLLAAALLLRPAVPLFRRTVPPFVASCAAVRLFSVTSAAVQAVVSHTLLAAAVNHAITLMVASKLARQQAGSHDALAVGRRRRRLLALSSAINAGVIQHSTEPTFNPFRFLADVVLRSSTALMGHATQVVVCSVGWAATHLLCDRVHMPYTGRTALLPPRWLEMGLNYTIGLACLVAYMAEADVKNFVMWLWDTQQHREHNRIAYRYEDKIRSIYNTLAAHSEHAAAVAGRPLATTWVADVTVLAVSEPNAVCIPGGSVIVHSGIIKLLTSKPDELAPGASDGALDYVVGHELGHATTRHSMEGVTHRVLHSLAIGASVGAACLVAEMVREGIVVWRKRADANRRAFRWPWQRTAEQRARDDTAGLVEAVSGSAQAVLHAMSALACLAASRRDEHEADFLALCLARDAGLNVAAVLSGAQLLFKRLPDDLFHIDMLSTHPSHTDRVAALSRAVHRLPPSLRRPRLLSW